MNTKQFLTLMLLGSVWGASFIFMRILAPVFGPFYTASFRILTAAITLFLYISFKRERLNWKADFKWFFLIGVFNTSIPFLLLSVAAMNIPANLSSIFNSTTPIFGLLFGALLINEKITVKKIIGLMLGTFGVFVISQGAMNTSENLIIGLISCLGAASSYGLAGTLIQKYTKHIPSRHLTFGAMSVGGLLLLPFGLLSPMTGEITVEVILYLLFFGIVGTAMMFLLFYKLISEIGPLKAFTVTYITPLFGILWSALFLKESIYSSTILGLVVIFTGIYFITSKNPLLKRRQVLNETN